jgi:hypothetical protein
MASVNVTPGYVWTSGETVTPTKLNSAAAPTATATLADGEVTNAKLASGIDGAKVADGSLSNAKLASGIDGAKVADGSLSNAKLASGIDGAKLTTGTLPIARIADGAVSAAKLAAKVTFPNYAAGEARNYNTLYQAATDGYLVIRAVGSFINGIQVVVGTTSSPTAEVWQAGDDINANTKRAATMLPIPKDIYYRVQPISGFAEFETVFLEWYPVIS